MSHAHIYNGAATVDVDPWRITKVARVQKVSWDSQGHDVRTSNWPLEPLRTEVIVGVIGDQVVLGSVRAHGDRLLQKRSDPQLSTEDDRTCLLHQPIRLEHDLRIGFLRNDLSTRESAIRLQSFAGVACSAAVATSQLSIELGRRGLSPAIGFRCRQRGMDSRGNSLQCAMPTRRGPQSNA